MLRLAIGVCVLASLIWFGGVYRLGDKTLAGHLDEVYKSPLVQHKIDALHKGLDNKLDDFALERSKTESTKRRVQARTERTERTPPPSSQAPILKHAPMAPVAAPELEPIDVRPNAGKPKKTPHQDTLTEDDREGLDKLLSDKLH